MAGVLQIHELTDTNTGVDKTSDTVRFKSADTTSVDESDRLQIPASNTSYSYTKQLSAYVSSAPDTDFSNLQAYSDGGEFSNTVAVIYDVTWTDGTFLTNVTDSIKPSTDLFTKTVGDAYSIDMNSWDATWTAGEGTGYWGSFLRLQMAVHTSATPGTLSPAETLTFSYDET